MYLYSDVKKDTSSLGLISDLLLEFNTDQFIRAVFYPECISQAYLEQLKHANSFPSLMLRNIPII